MLVKNVLDMLAGFGHKPSHSGKTAYAYSHRGHSLYLDVNESGHASYVMSNGCRYRHAKKAVINFVAASSLVTENLDDDTEVVRGLDWEKLTPCVTVRHKGRVTNVTHLPRDAAAMPTPVLIDWMQDNGHLELA